MSDPEARRRPFPRPAELKRVFAYFLPYWRETGLIVLIIIMGAVLALAPAVATQGIVDAFTRGHHGQGQLYRALLFFVGLIIAGSAIGSLGGVAQSYLTTRVSQRVMYDLRRELYDHLLRQSLRFYTDTKTGDIMSRVNNDVSGVAGVFSDTIVNLMQNLIVLVVTIGYMFHLDPLLALVSLVVLPFFVLPTRRVGRATYVARQESQEKLSEMSSHLQETLSVSGAILIKAFVKQLYESVRFDRLSRELMGAQIRTNMIGRWFFMMLAVLGTIGPAIIWLVGGWEAINGRIPISAVLAATIVLPRLYGPVGQLATMGVTIQGSMALFDRLFEYLDLPVEIRDAEDAQALEAAEGRVSFEHVYFSYLPVTDEAPRWALQDVDFTVEPGQMAALVGPSGAGKTTMTYLVPRFYDPQRGSIKLDGVDLRHIKLADLGKQIGIVPQEPYLFHASVGENILYARPDASMEEVRAAARAAYIDEFIQDLPLGYDTIVGERGYKLSGGEKQRIAIARVVLKDPCLLILDEATSSLDSQSEAYIQAALAPLMRGLTTLVIAHRLSTILSADVILVMQRGRLVERGTHDQVLEQGGLYAKLYRQQFKGGLGRITPAPGAPAAPLLGGKEAVSA